MKKQIFYGKVEIAITEADIEACLREWLASRFSYYDQHGNYHSHQFDISSIKHCPHNSDYALRFTVEQVDG